MFAEGPAMEGALILLSAATPPRTRRMTLSSSARYLPLLALLLLLTPPVVDEHFGSLAFFSLPRRATRHFGRQKHLLEFSENNRQKEKGYKYLPSGKARRLDSFFPFFRGVPVRDWAGKGVSFEGVSGVTMLCLYFQLVAIRRRQAVTFLS